MARSFNDLLLDTHITAWKVMMTQAWRALRKDKGCLGSV